MKKEHRLVCVKSFLDVCHFQSSYNSVRCNFVPVIVRPDIVSLQEIKLISLISGSDYLRLFNLPSLTWSISQSVFIVPCVITVMQQVRPLENVPVPHDLVHKDHSSHSDQYGQGSKSHILISSPVSSTPNDVSTLQYSSLIGSHPSPKNTVQQLRVRVFVALPHVAGKYCELKK